MVPKDWGILAAFISEEIRGGVDAVVVTHGTDTMAYSLSAISFMLQPIPIPIVFTGALIPYKEEGSDAHQNLWDALTFAAEHEYAGVYLVFPGEYYTRRCDKIFREAYWGPRVQSIRAGGKSFETVDNRYIARIIQGKVENSRNPFRLPRQTKVRVEVDTRLDERVEVFKVYPGFNPKLLDEKEVLRRGTRAVIIDLYHSGTACARVGQFGSYSVVQAIRKLVSKNVAVLGAGAPFRINEQYRSTSALVKAGLHPLGRMSLEATVVKAMCLMGRGVDVVSLGEAMDKPLLNEVFFGGMYD